MKTIRSIIAPVFISLVLLLFLEIFLRVFFPPKIDSTEHVAAFQYHPEYLVGLRPNMEKKYMRSAVNGSDTISWSSNTEGFRGKELSPKEVRIMVYGDSNIQARFSELSHTYPWYLQKFLNDSTGREVEVINSGIVGFGPDQSLLKFKEEKDVYNPDIIILQVFADNDFGDIVRNRLFKIDNNGQLIQSNIESELDPALEEYIERNKTFGYLRILDAVNKIRRSVKNEKEAIINADRMIALCNKLCTQEFESYMEEGATTFSHFADHYDIDVASKPESIISKQKLQLMDLILKEFYEETKASEIELVVLIEPSSVDLSENAYLSYKDLQKRFPNYSQDNLSSAIAAICLKYNIQHINLFDVFLNNEPSTLYFRQDDDHWTDKAQKIAAKLTSDQLYKNPLFKRDSIRTQYKDEE